MKLPNNDTSNIDNPDTFKRYVSIFISAASSILNSGILFTDNFDGKIVSVTFNSANTDVPVSHGLNRVPAGYIPTSLSAAMVIYSGSSSNDKQINLRSSAVGNATLLFF